MKAEDLNAALSNKDYVNTFEAGFVEHETASFSWAGVDQHHGIYLQTIGYSVEVRSESSTSTHYRIPRVGLGGLSRAQHGASI